MLGPAQALPGAGGQGSWEMESLPSRSWEEAEEGINALTLLFRILSWPLPGWVALGKLFTSLIPHNEVGTTMIITSVELL